MKPLTIEQLKELKPYRWVWIEEGNNKYYVEFIRSSESHFMYARDNKYGYSLAYSDYGTKWLAYEHKEYTKEDWFEYLREINKEGY